jgi:DNA polymerase-3 subunit delta'
LLIERDGIDPKMAEFAANAAQGHIGRAKYLATNEEARKTREKILNIPFTVKDLASAFEAANTLVELAKSQALAESEVRDEAELAKLKESYGTTGSKLATGGSKAVKELEKDHKNKLSRKTKDILDGYLMDIHAVSNQKINANLSYSLIKNQIDSNSVNTHQLLKINTATLEYKEKIKENSSMILTLESYFSHVFLI